MNYCAIATGNRPILIRCALQHARAVEFNVFALVFGEFATLYCRAADRRPYVIHGTQRDKHQFLCQFLKTSLRRAKFVVQ